MKPSLRTLSLTIVDIFGTFVPGMVWFVLGIVFYQLFFQESGSSLSITNAYLDFFKGMNIDESTKLAVFILLSIVVGFIIRPFSMPLADFLAALFSRKSIQRIKSKSFRDYMFPYAGLYRETPYYKKVTNIVQKYSGVSSIDLPGPQPFAFCKRFLRVISPELWEENERTEAEIRMLGALFLAAIASTLLSFLFLMIKGLAFIPFLKWTIVSVSLSIWLGIGFRRRRKKEVQYAYLNTIVGLAGFKMKMESEKE